jgi:DNA-binding GntR family transcriptional regulator
LEPIPSVETAQKAAKQIRRAIVSGAYKPGERLIERALVEQLGISRHPVREALRLLAREGFVDLHRNRGAQVSAIDAASVTEVYAIRKALGNLALDQLLVNGARVPAADLKRLETLKDRAARCAERKQHDQAIDADLAFQQAIVDASGLIRVRRLFEESSDDVRRFNALLGIRFYNQKDYVNRYIASLLTALGDGDLPRAQAIWQGKFEKAVERFLAAIEGKAIDGGIRAV